MSCCKTRHVGTQEAGYRHDGCMACKYGVGGWDRTLGWASGSTHEQFCQSNRGIAHAGSSTELSHTALQSTSRQCILHVQPGCTCSLECVHAAHAALSPIPAWLLPADLCSLWARCAVLCCVLQAPEPDVWMQLRDGFREEDERKERFQQLQQEWIHSFMAQQFPPFE